MPPPLLLRPQPQLLPPRQSKALRTLLLLLLQLLLQLPPLLKTDHSTSHSKSNFSPFFLGIRFTGMAFLFLFHI
jgi:hypothetical protein